MPAVQLLIFTDMDGSLLDHYTYSFEPAHDLLHKLEARGIPVIPCTSKTRAELEQLRLQLTNPHPFIVENGAAVCIPDQYFAQMPVELVSHASYQVKQFVAQRSHWQSLLNQLSPALQEAFISFAQVDVGEIQDMTGLPEAAAKLAAQREYGEPVQWLGDARLLEEFLNEMHRLGASVLRGGRFLHISGDCNKGNAMAWLRDVYADHNSDRQIITLALGDSQNDVAMLELADHAVMISSPVHDFPSMSAHARQDLYATQQTGPLGWVEGVMRVIEQLNIKLD